MQFDQLKRREFIAFLGGLVLEISPPRADTPPHTN
jgi:hypothetical protein